MPAKARFLCTCLIFAGASTAALLSTHANTLRTSNQQAAAADLNQRKTCSSRLYLVDISSVEISIKAREDESEIEIGKAIQKSIPAYPEQAKKEKITGKVTIKCEISESCAISSITVAEGHPVLSRVAIDAVKKGWKFSPSYFKANRSKTLPFSVKITFIFTR